MVNRNVLQLDQFIEEAGKNLSSGEKQLICICRAVLKKCKIVIMDEATANIDVRTEHVIQRVIHKYFEDCTVLTIAHRLSTVMKSDRVLVIEQGSVQEYDAPETLLEDDNSLFSSYARKLKSEE